MNPVQYADSHGDRLNLLIHLLAVPLFWLGTLGFVTFATMGFWSYTAGTLVMPAVSLALQGFGHKREQVPPAPFAGPLDFVTRIFAEQLVRFPAFVLTGRWWRNFRRSAS